MRPAQDARGHSRVKYDFDPPALAVWQGIEAECPPAQRHEYAALLAIAEQMLATRERRFPKMVEQREIAAEAAAAEIATFASIVADWRWVVAREGEPTPMPQWAAQAAALDQSLRTLADIAREGGGFTTDLAERAQLVIALRWWADDANRLALHSATRFNHAIRAKIIPQQEAPRHAA